MIAYEIKLNGRSLGTAGADDLSVLAATITAVGKLGSNSQGTKECDTEPHMQLRVGGLTSRAENVPDEHLEWIQQALRPGDVITLTILDAASADVPIGSQPSFTADYERQFEWAKNFYLANRDKFEDE